LPNYTENMHELFGQSHLVFQLKCKAVEFLKMPLFLKLSGQPLGTRFSNSCVGHFNLLCFKICPYKFMSIGGFRLGPLGLWLFYTTQTLM